MSKFEVGDIVKALPETDEKYTITNTKMEKGIVMEVREDDEIKVRVASHETDRHIGTTHWVDESCFEKIGHVKPFKRSEVIAKLVAGDKDVLIEYNLRGANLRGANLSGANLSGANLSDANLSDANLIDANLRGANLSGANLSDANLIDANLIDADLRGANLSDANLIDANLIDADLSDADLSGADLSGADLSGANLSDADLSQSKGLLDAINFMEAHFERTSEGYIVYKSFGAYRSAPESWKIKPGAVISENVNPNRTDTCGSGINVAPLDWVRRDNNNKPYKLLIRFEWMVDVVVPYNTDGKIRCGRAEIIGPVEE